MKSAKLLEKNGFIKKGCFKEKDSDREQSIYEPEEKLELSRKS